MTSHTKWHTRLVTLTAASAIVLTLGLGNAMSDSTSVDSLIDAIKQKQEQIKRLELEIQRIREALGPGKQPVSRNPSSR